MVVRARWPESPRSPCRRFRSRLIQCRPHASLVWNAFGDEDGPIRPQHPHEVHYPGHLQGERIEVEPADLDAGGAGYFTAARGNVTVSQHPAIRATASTTCCTTAECPACHHRRIRYSARARPRQHGAEGESICEERLNFLRPRYACRALERTFAWVLGRVNLRGETSTCHQATRTACAVTGNAMDWRKCVNHHESLPQLFSSRATSAPPMIPSPFMSP